MKHWRFLALFGIVFSACTMNPSTSGNGTLSMTFGVGGGARTILPAVPVDSYRISFSGPESIQPVDTADESATIDLPAGTWIVAVSGLSKAEQTIAQGSKEAVIVAGVRTSIAIDLQPLSGGTGAIDVIVSWPETIFVNGYTATIDGSPISSDGLTFISVAGAGGSLRGNQTLSSGAHTLKFDLRYGVSSSLCVIESVLVYDHLTSSATISLSESDFTMAPAVPSALSVSQSSTGLLLSWTDNSDVEKGLSVERSPDGESTWSIVGDLAANTENYLDTGVSDGGLYYYRVRSFNDTGFSAYSNTVSGRWVGSASITVTTQSPVDAAITFDVAPDTVFSQSATLNVSIAESFSAYAWALDGNTIAGASLSSVSVACSAISPGVHRVTAFVTRSGLQYSKSLRFYVVN